MTADVRVVSLVPSGTETMLGLGVAPVACTRFCDQPDIASIGGTKDPRVDEIVALAPDLVVVNDEENRYEDAARLLDAGLALHSMSPRSVAEVGPAVAALATALAVPVPSPFDRWDLWLGEHAATTVGRHCTLVWRRPWMSMAPDTYGSSLLERAGLANVLTAEPDRYPTVTLDEVAGLGPDLIVLPDEPYPFAARHVDEITTAVAPGSVALVNGRDLFWWGIRTPDALVRLCRALG